MRDNYFILDISEDYNKNIYIFDFCCLRNFVCVVEDAGVEEGEGGQGRGYFMGVFQHARMQESG